MGETHHNNSSPVFDTVLYLFTVFDRLSGLSEKSNSENMESVTFSTVIFFFLLKNRCTNSENKRTPPSPHLW